VDEATKAAQWLEGLLANARAAVALQPLGPRNQTMEQFDASWRGLVAACLRDITPYVGLSLAEARERADQTGDFLCVHSGPTGHRANWRADRVHVELDAEGRVISSQLDHPLPWETPTS
jgi:hypothetical protein